MQADHAICNDFLSVLHYFVVSLFRCFLALLFDWWDWWLFVFLLSFVYFRRSPFSTSKVTVFVSLRIFLLDLLSGIIASGMLLTANGQLLLFLMRSGI